jgi:hypothetical protein
MTELWHKPTRTELLTAKLRRYWLLFDPERDGGRQ